MSTYDPAISLGIAGWAFCRRIDGATLQHGSAEHRFAKMFALPPSAPQIWQLAAERRQAFFRNRRVVEKQAPQNLEVLQVLKTVVRDSGTCQR